MTATRDNRQNSSIRAQDIPAGDLERMERVLVTLKMFTSVVGVIDLIHTLKDEVELVRAKSPSRIEWGGEPTTNAEWWEERLKHTIRTATRDTRDKP